MRKLVDSFNKKKSVFYIFYTLFFLALFYICDASWFFLSKKSFIWSVDGMEIQYPFGVYVGQWIRKMVRAVLTGHLSKIPMWDMSIGYGSDVLVSCGNFFDPFNSLFAVFPLEKSELVYDIILVMKYYLSGLAFSWFSFEKKNDNSSTLIGALSYVFCPFMLIGFKQMSFITIMYLFPILMIGANRVWEKKKPYLFIFILALSCMTSYYFTWMMGIMIVIWAAVKYITTCILYGEDQCWRGIRGFLSLFFRYAVYSVIGLTMGMGFILPVIKNLSDMERLNLKYHFSFFYDRNYNFNLLGGIFGEWENGNDTIIGFSILSVICVILLFQFGKKFLSLKIYSVIGLIFLFLPLAGYLLNGLSYVSERWIFCLSFLSSYVVVTVLQNRNLVSLKMLITAMLLLIVALAATQLTGKDDILVYQNIFIGVAGLGMACLYKKIVAGRSGAFPTLICFIVMGIFWILNLWLPSFHRFSSRYDRFTDNMIEAGSAWRLLSDSGAKALLTDKDDLKNVRYDSDSTSRTRNSSMILGMNGMDFYDNSYNDNIDRYHNHLALLTSPYSFGYRGLNKRTELEYLNGVKYYIYPSGRFSCLPAGLNGYGRINQGDTIRHNHTDFTCAEASFNAEMGYFFEKGISADTYENLTPYERQQVLMKAVVLDDNSKNQPGELKNIKISRDIIPFDIDADQDSVSFKNGKINVREKDGFLNIHLSKSVRGGYELYVFLKNLQAEDRPDLKSYYVNVQAYNKKEKVQDLSASVEAMTPRTHMYGGKHNWLLNLGYTDSEVTDIHVSFDTVAEFTIDDIVIYAKPLAEVETNISNLNRGVSDYQYKGNTFSASTCTDSDGYAFFSVPYSEGWKAFIDGKETEIIKADDAFMAVECKKGKHKLKFVYYTPFLREGLCVSIASLIAVLALALTEKIKRHIIRDKREKR